MNRCILVLLLLISSTAYAQKPQVWQTIHQPLGTFKDIQFSFRQQYRFQLSDFRMHDARFSLYSKVAFAPFLDVEIHYTWINSRPADQNFFDAAQRLDFELNPHFQITKNIELKFRNRYELLKFEHFVRLAQRFRQKHEIVINISQGQLKNISINNEIFYNVDTYKVFEYRFIPLELRFDIPDKHTYTLYTMVRWIDHQLGWNPQFILGSTLNW